jgi:hypothetical protein
MGIREMGTAASDDFMKYIMGVLAAAKRTPMNAREAADAPAMLRPIRDPSAFPLRDPATGRMMPVPFSQYSPGQVVGSRAAIAAPVVAGGYGANELLNDAPVSRPVNDYSKGDDEYKGYMVNDYSKGDDEYKSFMASSPANSGMTRDKFTNLPGYEGEGTPAARPAPQRRPSAPDAAPAAAAEPSLRDRLFGGQDFQSNNRAVVSRPQGPMPDGAPQRATLNWGDSGSAADFFRADKAMQGLRKNDEEFVGMASGGAANGSSSKSSGGGRDAAIHKALEIIHNLLMQRR